MAKALPPGARAAACCAVACAAALPAAAAPTDNLPPVVGIDGSLAVNSVEARSAGASDSTDVIASLRPYFQAAHKGPRVSYDVQAAATLQAHSDESGADSVLPDLRGGLNATLVERWLYLDAGAYVRYAEADPFGARTDTSTGVNRSVDSGYFLRPSLSRDLTPTTNLLVRDEFGQTSDDAVERTRLTSNRGIVRLERRPTPFGGAVSYTRLDDRASGGGDSRYTLETARVGGTVLLDQELELGVDGGVDRSDDHFLERHTDALYGGHLFWSPGPRTSLRAEVEHRYFGVSGDFSLTHRTPFTAIDLQVSRQPVDSTTSFGTLTQGADIRDFLNSILTTRYSDPIVRAGIVDNLVVNHGLDNRNGGAVNLVGNYPQLQTSVRLGWTLLGRRDTLLLSGYGVNTRAILRDGDPLAALAAADSRQRGALLEFTHKLTPETTAALSGSWSRIEGLALHDGELSNEQKYRLSLVDALSARSEFSIALQWTRFTTNASGQSSFDATLGMVGLAHRF